jgi:hypothetical protein
MCLQSLKVIGVWISNLVSQAEYFHRNKTKKKKTISSPPCDLVQISNTCWSRSVLQEIVRIGMGQEKITFSECSQEPNIRHFLLMVACDLTVAKSNAAMQVLCQMAQKRLGSPAMPFHKIRHTLS